MIMRLVLIGTGDIVASLSFNEGVMKLGKKKEKEGKSEKHQ